MTPPKPPSILEARSVSENELRRLLQRAMTDPKEEPAFFRALLDATVYAHVPISDDSGRLRFVQFARPDNGELVLPFFATESEAYSTAGDGRRVVALPGRTLLTHTLGATLLLDPNGARCTLYPEEVSALIATGTVAAIESEIVQHEREVLLGPIQSIPEWFKPIWFQLLRKLQHVEKAYLLATAPASEPERLSLLIVLGVAPAFSERTTRALATALTIRGAELRLSIDSVCYDPSKGPPELLKGMDIEPAYRRGYSMRKSTKSFSSNLRSRRQRSRS
jgi:hypothetical protein